MVYAIDQGQAVVIRSDTKAANEAGGLPYQSDIMNISEADWLSMGAIAQRTVLNNVEAKLRLYQEYQAQPDLWVDLSGTRSAGEAMYPVPLDALP